MDCPLADCTYLAAYLGYSWWLVLSDAVSVAQVLLDVLYPLPRSSLTVSTYLSRAVPHSEPRYFFFPLMNKAQNYSQIGILHKAVCNQMHHWLLLFIKLMGSAFRVQALGFRINTNLCSTLKSNFLESVLLCREVFFLVHLHWRPYVNCLLHNLPHLKSVCNCHSLSRRGHHLSVPMACNCFKPL
jgi:hypothetical protein